MLHVCAAAWSNVPRCGITASCMWHVAAAAVNNLSNDTVATIAYSINMHVCMYVCTGFLFQRDEAIVAVEACRCCDSCPFVASKREQATTTVHGWQQQQQRWHLRQLTTLFQSLVVHGQWHVSAADLVITTMYVSVCVCVTPQVTNWLNERKSCADAWLVLFFCFCFWVQPPLRLIGECN